MSKGAYKRIVVKVGTSTLTDERGRVDSAYIDSLMSQVSSLLKSGSQVAIVSSGAISAGLERLGLDSRRPKDMPTLQAAAAVGSVELISRYRASANACGFNIAQVLITRKDTSSRSSYLHARDTLMRLFELGVVPVVNENDTVATDEIRFGDNDTLAATIATTVAADLVVLLTDIEGLYTADPRISADAELIKSVGRLSDAIVDAAGDAGSESGSGGMATKINAARVLMSAGVPMVICQGRQQQALLRAVSGDELGTRFVNDEALHSLTPKKLWVALGDATHGSVLIDDGAAGALRFSGASLLPVGVRKVSGSFNAGDAIEICEMSGKAVARGIARMGSAALEKVAGMRTEQIEASFPGLMGAHHELCHRDEMIVF